ncbi:MAG: histidine kinase [Chloroflexota bacterium]|nr:histidine kinase [Chloroflexota bacterium]
MQRSLRWWSGLQARMTFSYVWVTVASVLFLELLVFAALAYSSASQFDSTKLPQKVKYTAHLYAQEVSSLSEQVQLGPHFPFIPAYSYADLYSQDTSNAPHMYYNYNEVSGSDSNAFALIITPDMRIAASSYPQHYTGGESVVRLLPDQASAIARALTGTSGSGSTMGGQLVYAVETVWNKRHVPIGAVYIQALQSGSSPWLAELAGAVALVGSGIILLVVTVPIGGLFGIITTRGLVSRLRNLVSATTLFANGNYAQRVRVTRRDEVGQLEEQFNRMAEQLVTSISKRQELAEQNARLAERSRISRELHDAISQDLFSLSMLAGGLQSALPSDSALQPRAALLEQTTTTMIREMRALLLELRPSQLEHLSLQQALEDIALAYSQRLGITVTTAISEVPLSAKAEHALLRITQEALTNAIRHGNASSISLSLAPQENVIVLRVTDNGKGCDPRESETQHGLGLRLIEERVQELQGTFELESAPDQGTSVSIYLPREQISNARIDC